MLSVLRTDRFRLEPIAPNHAQALRDYRVRNREHLAQWEPERDDDFFSIHAIAAEIEREVASADEGRAAQFAVFEHDGDEIVALVYLLQIVRGVRQTATLAYSVDERHQGKGFATEAARAVVRFAFDDLNLHRLETGYQPHNAGSGQVLRKLGFHVEGYARDYLMINGAWRDSILVGLLNEEWKP